MNTAISRSAALLALFGMCLCAKVTADFHSNTNAWISETKEVVGLIAFTNAVGSVETGTVTQAMCHDIYRYIQELRDIADITMDVWAPYPGQSDWAAVQLSIGSNTNSYRYWISENCDQFVDVTMTNASGTFDTHFLTNYTPPMLSTDRLIELVPLPSNFWDAVSYRAIQTNMLWKLRGCLTNMHTTFSRVFVNGFFPVRLSDDTTWTNRTGAAGWSDYEGYSSFSEAKATGACYFAEAAAGTTTNEVELGIYVRSYFSESGLPDPDYHQVDIVTGVADLRFERGSTNREAVHQLYANPGPAMSDYTALTNVQVSGSSTNIVYHDYYDSFTRSTATWTLWGWTMVAQANYCTTSIAEQVSWTFGDPNVSALAWTGLADPTNFVECYNVGDPDEYCYGYSYHGLRVDSWLQINDYSATTNGIRWK